MKKFNQYLKKYLEIYVKTFSSIFKKCYRKEDMGKGVKGYLIYAVWEVNDKLIKEYTEDQSKTPLEAE